MALDKLTILVELEKGLLQFDEHDGDHRIEAMFNPKSLGVNRAVQWESGDAAKRDCPELQYTTAQPATLTVDLFFDTYDRPDEDKPSVYAITKKLADLTLVRGDKHRPPVCQLFWGDQGVIFQGVLQQLDQQYTMFMPNGRPVRATVKCTFMQWRANANDLKKQNLMSADVAKTWLVRRGQTLATIAAQEYLDPANWRDIAAANGIDDPLALAPGTTLLLPALPVGRTARSKRQEDL
jgi:nucleoid-associated protein YgaU